MVTVKNGHVPRFIAMQMCEWRENKPGCQDLLKVFPLKFLTVSSVNKAYRPVGVILRPITWLVMAWGLFRDILIMPLS